MPKQPTTNQIDSLEKALYTMQRRADRLAQTWSKQNRPDDLFDWMFMHEDAMLDEEEKNSPHAIAGAIAVYLNNISAACDMAMQYIDDYREEVGS